MERVLNMSKIKPGILLAGLVVLSIVISGCRGNRSEKPAIHLNPNMDIQSKITAQTKPITPPQDTVPWGVNPDDRADALAADPVYYRGQTTSGDWVSSVPVTVNAALLDRGQDRFNIYCAACHDRSGTGNGPVVQRGFTPPPKLSDPRVIAYRDGQIFDIISHGIRSMPGHDKQIPVEDRWAIVAYVRAIQKMNTATIQDVPESQRSAISK